MNDREMDGTSDVSAFILAGGKSTRMGTDKAFVLLDGRTLLAHVLEVARSVTPRVTIVGDRAKFSDFAPTVEDIYPNCGPLGGIHAALDSSETELNLILAVDTPFIGSSFVQYLVSCAKSTTAIVILPRAEDRLQPLCAVYRHAFAAIAEKALLAGRYKIDSLFEEVPTLVISEKDLIAKGFGLTNFRNLNTPRDLMLASKPSRLGQ